MFLTNAELEAELKALEEQEGFGVPRETNPRILALEAWVRSLPTPPTTVLHPSEYPARAPQYKSMELPHLGQHTVEDFRAKKPNGAPIRILDPENVRR